MRTSFFVSRLCIICFGIFAAAGIAGCSESSASHGPLAPGRTEKFTFPMSRKEMANFNIFLSAAEGKDYLTCANINTQKAYFKPLQAEAAPLEFNLAGLDSVFPLLSHRYRFWLQSPDSLFVLPDETRMVFLINTAGEVLDEWEVFPATNGAHFVLTGFGNAPFEVHNGNMYVHALVIDKSWLNQDSYYSIPPDLIIPVNDTTQPAHRAGCWPESYFETYYHNEYMARICRARDGKVQQVYSFSADHDIYVYEDTTFIKKVTAASRHISAFTPFAGDSTYNIAYSMKYQSTTARYEQLYYNPCRDEFYRVAVHASDYISGDGATVNGPQDQPWSLILLDGNLQVKAETEFDPKKYSNAMILPVCEGLWIANAGAKHDTANEFGWDFTLFEWKSEAH